MIDGTREGRRHRRLRVLAVVVVLLGASLLCSNALIRRVSADRVEWALGGCVEIGDARLTIPGRLLALDLLRGRLHDVSFEAEEVEVAGLRLDSISGSVESVHVGAFGGPDGLELNGAQLTLRLDQDDLNRLLQDMGIPAAAQLTNDGAVVQVASTPVTIGVDIRSDGGAVEVAAEPPLDLLLHLRLELPGIDVQRVDVTTRSLIVEAEAEAEGKPRAIACGAEEIMQTELLKLKRLAALLQPDSSGRDGLVMPAIQTPMIRSAASTDHRVAEQIAERSVAGGSGFLR